MAMVEINIEKCKGCGLCVEVCPMELLQMSREINSFGNYYPVQHNSETCVACAMCAVMCADACITVYKETEEV